MRATVPFTSGVSLLVLAACTFGTPTDSAVPKDSGGAEDSTPETAWYLTCGDPVCQEYAGPTAGVELCDDEAAGGECTTEGEICDPVDGCNAMLICATEDPTQQEGGCPISLAKYKREIRYLSDGERATLARGALEMPIATWSYRWEPPGAAPHLGFVIDDNEGSYAVAADGAHVDLYGYTSLALLSVQEQSDRLAEAEARLARQEQELAALRAQVTALLQADGRR